MAVPRSPIAQAFQSGIARRIYNCGGSRTEKGALSNRTRLPWGESKRVEELTTADLRRLATRHADLGP